MSHTDTNVTPLTSVSRVRNAPPPTTPAREAAASPGVPAAAASARPTLGLVLFGRDAAGKRRAAYFPADTAARAERAAAMMGLQVFRLTDPAQTDRAAALPKGRFFASGRALVPLVKDAALDAVFKPEVEATAAESGDEPHPDTGDLLHVEVGTPVASQSEITVGSLVLVGEVYPLCGWYEATVVTAPGDDLFTLRWRDWPDDPPVVRRRDDLAVLPPGSLTAMGEAGAGDER